MNSQDIIDKLIQAGAIGILRFPTSEGLLQVAEALRGGGLIVIEVTMTIDGGIELIAKLKQAQPQMLIGAGTVLDEESARNAMLAGADFIVSPTLRTAVIETVHRYGKVAIPGAMTPTEILKAWESEADLVKVFPAGALGPSFLRSIAGPFPDIPLVPTGGITAENAGEFIEAGAVTICAGGWLTGESITDDRELNAISERTRSLLKSVREARRDPNTSSSEKAK